MLPELLVATDVDFSLLKGTRPIASGQWEDVVRVEAEREGFIITLRLQLENGKTFTAHDDAPGWDDLIEHGADVLEGFPLQAELMARLSGATGAVTVYER